jgi:hypothetical protein
LPRATKFRSRTVNFFCPSRNFSEKMILCDRRHMFFSHPAVMYTII